MSKISVVLHNEMYQQVLKNDKSLSLDTFASIDFYMEVDNDAVLSRAMQLASNSKKVVFTRKTVDGDWEMQEIGPINLGTLNISVEHNLPKFDFVDDVDSKKDLFGVRYGFKCGDITASFNGLPLGTIQGNFDDTSTGENEDGE